MTAAIPTQSYASAVQGVLLRACQLMADGTLATTTTSGYVLERFVSATYTPVMEGGNDISLQGADGSMLVSYQTKDVLVRATLALAIADPDPQFKQIIVGGTVFVDDTIPLSPVAVGWAPAPAGTISNPNGCSVEVWANAISGGRKSTTLPFLQYVFPMCFLDPTGDHAFENGVMGQEFTGYSEGNTGFGTGPDTDWLWTSAQPYQHARVATTPAITNGYITPA